MTRDQLREKIDNIYDGIPIDDEHQIEYANNEAEKLVKKECYAVEIHAPHLTDNMHPAFELVPGFICPHNRDGKCLTCPQFVTYQGGENGVFSYMTFSGYCAKEITLETNATNEDLKATRGLNREITSAIIVALVEYAKRCSECYAYDWDNQFKVNEYKDHMDLLQQTLISKLGDIRSWSQDIQLALGFLPFEINGKDYMLIPLYLYNQIPDGTKLICIDGEIKTMGQDRIDNDVRYGCIAYAFYDEEVSNETSEVSGT